MKMNILHVIIFSFLQWLIYNRSLIHFQIFSSQTILLNAMLNSVKSSIKEEDDVVVEEVSSHISEIVVESMSDFEQIF